MKITFITQRQDIVDGVPQVDDFNNPIIKEVPVHITECLIAPITEPTNIREQQAMEQARIQVRVHIPKFNDEDISNSYFYYDDKKFKVDSDSVVFMKENTPTKWNRYFRAEAIEV